MRRSAPLLLIAVLAAVATGCGAGNSIDPVAQAAEATQAVDGAHVNMRMTVEAAGQTVPVTGEGDMATKNPPRGHLTMDMSALAKVPNAGISAKDARLEMVMTGDTVYMSSPIFERQLPGGKSWLKLDLQKAGRRLGVDFQSLQQAGANTGDQLGYLRAAGDTKKVGTDTVDGVRTTHYHAVVDLEKYPDLVPESRRQAARRSVEKLIQITGESSYPIDVWIDGKKHVRRQVYSQTMQAGGQKIALRVRADLSRFGERITTKAPPAGDTVDATKLVKPPSGS